MAFHVDDQNLLALLGERERAADAECDLMSDTVELDDRDGAVHAGPGVNVRATVVLVEREAAAVVLFKSLLDHGRRDATGLQLDLFFRFGRGSQGLDLTCATGT